MTNRFELPPCCRLMMTRWPSGEKRGENVMFGKLPTISRCCGLGVEQVDPRLTLAERHVGDFLSRRREARRQHEVGAVGQIAHVGAVLVHQREALDAALLRPGLVDEYDAAVEVALLAGQPLVDRVRNDVGDAAGILRRSRNSCCPTSCAAAEHVPQPEIGLAAGRRAGGRCARWRAPGR